MFSCSGMWRYDDGLSFQVDRVAYEDELRRAANEIVPPTGRQ